MNGENFKKKAEVKIRIDLVVQFLYAYAKTTSIAKTMFGFVIKTKEVLVFWKSAPNDIDIKLAINSNIP